MAWIYNIKTETDLIFFETCIYYNLKQHSYEAHNLPTVLGCLIMFALWRNKNPTCSFFFFPVNCPVMFKLFIILKYFIGSDDKFISAPPQYTGDKFNTVVEDSIVLKRKKGKSVLLLLT